MATTSSNAVGQSAVAFRGGGILSVACQSALTSALLAANARRTGAPPTMTGSALFKNFDIVSSVSGGGWFSCELIYSPRFLKLIESMAHKPATAGMQFDEDWISGWLGIQQSTPALRKIASLLARLAVDPVLAQSIIEVGHFLKTGLDWNNFVWTLLEGTASIDGAMPMGSDVQSWASGKVYLVTASVVVPTGMNGFKRVVVFPPGGEDQADGTNFASYVASSNEDPTFPAYVPSQFSVTLGAGEFAPAPVKYIADTAMPALTTLSYTGAGPVPGILGWCSTERHSGESEPLERFANFNYFAGHLPIGDVMACTSSFLSDIAWLPRGSGLDPFEQLVALANGNFATYAGDGAHAKGLTDAVDLVREIFSSGVNKTRFDSLRQQNVTCTFDGGFTDVTSIAAAVAAGATEVVAFLNTTGTDQPVPDAALFDLFTWCEGGRHVNRRFAASEDMDGACAASIEQRFEIFEMCKEDAMAQYAEISKSGSLTVPAGSNKQLISIVVGSYIQLETRTEPFFGVKGGQKTDLHVLAVTSKLSLGGDVNVHDFSTLVQEIIDTVLDPRNQDMVEGTVLPWFLSSLAPPAKDIQQDVAKWRNLGA